MGLTKRRPEVTVVMPAYRHERFVDAAIGSILAQTVGDWELIVIDDCSPDGTWDRIRHFADPRIRAYRHDTNMGAHVSLNEGIALARGRYISILNSDDMYHPARLEKITAWLDGADVDVVGTALRLVDSGGNPVSDPGHFWIRWYEGLIGLYRSSGDPALTLLSGNVFVTTSNFVMGADAARRIGPFANLRYAHDYAFLLKAVADPAVSLAFLSDEPLLDYRWHESNTIKENSYQARREEFDVVCAYLPMLVPEAARPRVEKGLSHVSALWTPQEDSEGRELARLYEDMRRLRIEFDRARAEARALRASRSFRLGSAILDPVRGLRHLFGRCRKGHGA